MPLILFHRHTPWRAEIRCSTNIFAQLFLSKGFDVAYMQGMVHGGNLLARRGQWRSWLRGPRRDGNAWVFTPFSLLPHARRWPFNTRLAASLSYRSCLPGIAEQLRRGGLDSPDLIWSASPGSIGLRRIFPAARFVFQAVDYYPAFSGDAVKPLERADYHGADHVFATAESLRNYIVGEHETPAEKVTVLGQGVFTDAYRKEWPLPDELAGLPRPIGIWVGVVAKGDPEMFAAAAAALKALGGTLVLLGPRAQWAESLSRSVDNVRVLGPCAPDRVPAFLAHSDLAFMLYDRGPSTKYRGQNPLKLYEYAAAGLPIVSTPHDEFSHLNPPVVEAATAREVGPGIEACLRDGREMRRRAREFAGRHSWDRAFERAEREVDRLLGRGRSAQ